MLRHTLTSTSRFVGRFSGRRLCSSVEGPTIGIDLGTTTTYVGCWESGKPRILENSEGHRVTPSIVAKKKDEWLVGLPAKRQMVMNPRNTFTAVKRYIGKKYKDPNVKRDRERAQFKVVSHGGDAWLETTDGAQYPPQQLSAMVLEKAKAAAEDYFGEPVKNAVITVPAYFNEVQRTATKEAGQIAGLNVLRIVNEPTAAALAYGLKTESDEGKLVAVYDLGGGTFDISILEIGGGLCEVKATNGDTHLGGEDFDHAIIDYLCSQFEEEHGIDLTDNPTAMQRVREEAEKAKIELSSAKSVEINLPFLAKGNDGQAINFALEFTRGQLEKLVSKLIQDSLEPCKKALADAGADISDIDEVLLVGGMTRMPKVAQVVKEFFNQEPNKSINPDEAVAMGASVQSGVLAGKVEGLVLVDVIPISLGIETHGGVFTKLIDRNTAVPVKKTQTFTTVQDSQTHVGITVFQGEREFCKDNKRLGKFDLNDIPAAPGGVPQIEVTFEVDANSIMHVSAKDQGTGKDSSITLKREGLSKDEIEKITKDAEKNRKGDQKKRRQIEIRNEVDRIILNTEKQIKAYTVVSEDKIKALKESLTELKEMKASNATIEDLEEKMKETQDKILECGKEQYQNQGKKDDDDDKDDKKKDDDDDDDDDSKKKKKKSEKKKKEKTSEDNE